MEGNPIKREYWLAGELAKAAGVSTDTLRHYEHKGVLSRPKRARNGYRLYPESALERVLLVRRALSIGFSLGELALILSERDKGAAPCREVHRLAAIKLQIVEEQLVALAALRDELRLTLADWENRISGAASGSRLGLLETLVSNEAHKGWLRPVSKNSVRGLPPVSKSKKKEGKQ